MEFSGIWFAVNAGILSGFSGLESVPGPQLPQFDFLNKWNGLRPAHYLFYVQICSSLILSSSIVFRLSKRIIRRSMLSSTRDSNLLPCLRSCWRSLDWIKKGKISFFFSTNIWIEIVTVHKFDLHRKLLQTGS